VKIRVIWPGKTQEEWVRRGIDEYAGRIRRYSQLDLAEAREGKGGSAEAMREREGERLAKLVPKNARLILLDERGEEMTSPDLAGVLSRYRRKRSLQVAGRQGHRPLPDDLYPPDGAGFPAGTDLSRLHHPEQRTLSPLDRLKTVRHLRLETLHFVSTLEIPKPFHADNFG
jgi:hypothetical protein